MSAGHDPKLLEQAKQMQERIDQIQKTLNARRFEAASGGGMVRATVTGALRVVSIEIEDAFFKLGDKEMIQDLAAAAINAAIVKAQEGANEEFIRMQQHLMHGTGF
jgi:nucleoid-associated protein EbfC